MCTKDTKLCDGCVKAGMMMALVCEINNDELGMDEVGFLVKEGGKYIVRICCNDVFHYATADAIDVPDNAIETVYQAWINSINPVNGFYQLVAWMATQRGMKPVAEVCEKMKAAGVVLPVSLADNPENIDGRRW